MGQVNPRRAFQRALGLLLVAGLPFLLWQCSDKSIDPEPDVSRELTKVGAGQIRQCVRPSTFQGGFAQCARFQRLHFTVERLDGLGDGLQWGRWDDARGDAEHPGLDGSESGGDRLILPKPDRTADETRFQSELPDRQFDLV